MSDFDYLIVGAGLFGATCARILTDAGKRVAILEKRNHIGGNCYDESIDGLLVHKYGGHIFHTNSKRVWAFVNRFATWQEYTHRVKVYVDGVYYSFPPNRTTIEQLGNPNGKAEQMIRDKFFVGYSEKQWGRPYDQIPNSITARIPMRDNYDDRYFSDHYQGLPFGGYTQMVQQMLAGIPKLLSEDFLTAPQYWKRKAERIIYTGEIDRLFDYIHGRLEYRSLRFDSVWIDATYYQEWATVNYPSKHVPYTRIIEWKHFGKQHHERTYVTLETPQDYDGKNEPYYPIPDERNIELHKRYKAMLPDWLICGGRLGAYKYMNMDQAIGAAMALVNRLN